MTSHITAAVELTIPRLTSNDDRYGLIEWLVEDGQEVGEGEVVCVLESSKALEELESPATGVIRGLAPDSTDYPVGHCIATIGAP